MPRALKVYEEFDFDEIRHASDQLQTLTARLPVDAVQSLANEVVQRLSAKPMSSNEVADTIPTTAIEQLCSALISDDPDAAAVLISEIRGDGTSVADVYQLYLAAAARRLGEMWASDDLSFVEVTIGTSRILAIMRSLRSAFRADLLTKERALIFATVPDEQHTIGITMAADIFRREGWEIELLVGDTHEGILDRVSTSDALVVGLTAHGSQSLAGLIRLVLAIRIVNPTAYVLISGNIIEDAEDIITLTGADGFASDIDTALVEVERLYELADVSG